MVAYAKSNGGYNICHWRFLKVSFSIFIIFFVCNLSFSQNFNYQNVYVGIDGIQKWTYQKASKSGDYDTGSHYYKQFSPDGLNLAMIRLPEFELILGYKTKHLNFELAYRQMDYFGGFITDISVGYYQTQERGHHYTGRLITKPLSCLLFKNKLSFGLGLGYTIAKSVPYKRGFLGDGIVQSGYYGVYYKTEDYLDITYGWHQYFSLLEGIIRLEWEHKWFSLSLGSGYVKGFKTLAVRKVEYTYQNSPTQYYESTIDGTNIYYSLGLRLPVGKYIEKAVNRKKKE